MGCLFRVTRDWVGPNGRSGHVRYIPIATEMVNRLREGIVTDGRGLFAGLVEHFARAA